MGTQAIGVSVASAMRSSLLPTFGFRLEGGRLAAIQWPTTGELCLRLGSVNTNSPISLVTNENSVYGMSVAGFAFEADPKAVGDARNRTYSPGSKAHGGSG